MAFPARIRTRLYSPLVIGDFSILDLAIDVTGGKSWYYGQDHQQNRMPAALNLHRIPFSPALWTLGSSPIDIV
jgi:hypothetical protein